MKNIIRLLKTKVDLSRRIGSCFTDIRHKPQIPLTHIITSIFLMPIVGLRSFLALDNKSRQSPFKKLLGSKRKMVCSDSTIERVLRWIKNSESQKWALGFPDLFEGHDALKIKLTQKGKSRRFGIIDGSFMGGHWVSVLSLAGKINFPILIKSYPKIGKELDASHKILDQIPQTLQKSSPELFLMDSLYFNQGIFDKIVNGLGAHFIVKSRDADFREVLKDAELVLEHYSDESLESKGFDESRMCSYRIYSDEGEYKGFPLKIIRVDEHYNKRAKGKRDVSFYAVCSDLDMEADEIREAAHWRWQIENNVFKRLNEHCGSKLVRTSNLKSFINWLQIICMGLSLFDFLMRIIEGSKEQWKKFCDGSKATWKNLQSIFWEKVLTHMVLI